MKDLEQYLIENEYIEEGLIGSSAGFIYIRRMDPKYLLNGVLNMYEYIIDKGDIKLFYQDFPVKERPFWTNLYKLYEGKVWSIFDASKPNIDAESQESQSDQLEDIQNNIQDLKDRLSDYKKEDDGSIKSRQQIRNIETEIRRKERELTRTSTKFNKQNVDVVGGCFDKENELIKVTPEFRRQLRNIINGSSLKQDDLSAANVDKIMLIDDPQFDKRYIFTINKVQGVFRRMFRAVDIKFLEKLFEKIGEI